MSAQPVTLDSLRLRAQAMGVAMSDKRLIDIIPMMQAIEIAAKELLELDLDGYGQANINSLPGQGNTNLQTRDNTSENGGQA